MNNNRNPPKTDNDSGLNLLSTKQVSDLLNISQKTLCNQRVKGDGIKFVKIGGCVRYRMSDIQAYLEANVKSSTSQ